jgi:2-keto-4-pentenoate hydratase/2-oxohepta-3-ene-1,7-dioic acid hydratase in catechol pathway
VHGGKLSGKPGYPAAADQRVPGVPEAVLDPGGTTVLPEFNFSICHYEAELVAVIGKRGKDVAPSEAMDYIFGYTARVDISASGAWGFLSKAYDGFSQSDHPS